MAASDENTYNYAGLDQGTIQCAKKELGENPDQVKAHIASLRRWVKSMPHLTCRTDDIFLLRFLRTAKFDQSRAQQMLDNFCTVRSSPRGTPEWFVPFELDSPILNQFLQMTMNLKLGYNDNGESVVMASFDGYDPERFEDPVTSLLRAIYMIGDILFTDERSIINGVRFVSNMEGATRKQMKIWENPKLSFKMMRNWQDAFPLRIKGIIYYKEPAYFDIVFQIIQPFMKDKLKKRITRCGSDVNKLKKAMGPGAERLLPSDMGGSNKSREELIAERRETIVNEAAIEERRKLATIKVDESKRQANTKDYLKSYEGGNDPSMGITGTFTKLNVD